MARLFERSMSAPETLEALRVRHELLERLSRIQRSISHGAPLDDVLASIATGASELLGDPVAGLRLVSDDDPSTMMLVAAVGLTADQLEEVRQGRVGEGAGGRAILTGEVVVVEDYSVTSDGIARFGEFGVQNALAAPVRLNDAVVGSLTVASFETGRRYGVVEQDILLALAEHAGLALLDASLIDERERIVQRRGEERFQALVRHSSDLIAIVDRDGTIGFATPSVARALALRPEQLLGSSLLSHIHEDDRPAAARTLETAAARPGTTPAADWRLVPAGTAGEPDQWIHAEVLATNLLDHPSVHGIVLNARDVTERKRAERERRQQDARYRQIIDTTHDGVWVTDTEDRTLFANGALARMLGRTPEALTGLRPADFMDESQAALVHSAMDRRRAGVHERYEVTLRRDDGSPLHLSISGTPIFEHGRFAGALALCGDITELVQGREKQAGLATRLRHAQELEMLGRLAGQVAHDFNQVLAVILGYASLLQSRATTQPGDEDLARIVEAAEHGAALARQLVTFSRRDGGEPEVLDLSEIALATLRLVQRTAPPGVTLDAHPHHEPLPVSIDPTKLRQILMNLIDNATDAVGESGELVLATSPLRLAPDRPLPAGLAPGDYACLLVADTGVGMAPDVLARALEPAYTTKPSGSGTGLGLAIVHAAVRSAGGHIALRSEPGTGTTIEILLPLADGDPAAVTREDANPAPGPAGASATILLVEDDAAVLRLTARVLTEAGYGVLSATDGERALELLTVSSIDLLVTDQTLPGVSGLELVGRIADLRPGTPALVMSGYAAEVAPSRPAGVDWLHKPFGADALLGAVRAALATP